MLWLVLFLFTLCATAKRARYTNEWVAEIRGGPEVAQRVARDSGYIYKGQLAQFDDHYLLVRRYHPEVGVRDSSHLTRALEDLDEVKWAEQQFLVERSKRGLYHEREEQDPWKRLNGAATKYQISHAYLQGGYGEQYGVNRVNNEPDVDTKEIGKGDFDSMPSHFSTEPSKDSQLDTYTGATLHVMSFSNKSSPYENVFNDPMFEAQWYEQDYRLKDMPVMDHNVVPVYKMGYTGKGVIVAVVDDGVEHYHRDIAGNVDEARSYDYCDDKVGCEPDRGAQSSSSAGTQNAGIIAMVANNRKCGVGIAYKATIVGAKVFCLRSVSSVVEAKALTHELGHVDIYSCAWGNLDNGEAMDKLSQLGVSSIAKGVKEGRNNKGSIYVFSAGNGKALSDNCAADGVINIVDVIVVGSANQFGKATFYSERCTAVFATTYSGETDKESVVATDLDGSCVKSSTGTSASVAIASAIIALLLDARSDLSYRDVMHIIAWGSEVAPLANNDNYWYKNGRGLWVSNDFGFGLLNAENMVNLAKNWNNVPRKNTCTETIKVNPSQFYAYEGLKLFHYAKACQDEGDDGVHYLEHIELTTTVKFAYRGAITIYIYSPAGTKSALLEPRRNDNNRDGLQSWSIKSVHNWGENPEGKWVIEVKISDMVKPLKSVVSVRDFRIIFHGTHSKPNHYNRPRSYAAFRLPDGRTSHVPS